MPVLLIVVLVGVGIALLLVRSGYVTSELLISGVYGVLGAVLGLMILRYLVGPLGIYGGIVGAGIGAVVLLFLMRRGRKPK